MLARVFLFASLAAIALAITLSAAHAAAPDAARIAAPAVAPAVAPDSPVQRSPAAIVCVGSALTEIVFALGAGDRLLAVDDGSVFPAEARALPKLGYQRALSAEGLLALGPELLLATPDAGPPAVLQQLRDAGVVVHVIPSVFSTAGVEQKIAAVARALDRQPQGAELITALYADIAGAKALLTELAPTAPPRVLCIYARGRGTLHVCGADTALDAMVSLAGGVNALAGLTGSAPLGGESAVAAAPEVILLPRGSADASGGNAALLQEAGLALTPAGRAGRIVVMDDELLLGFGPRTGQALVELVKALHVPAAAATPAPSSAR